MTVMNDKYPVTLEQHLDWGDMDAFGHINNIMYFRFFENARIAYFQKIAMYDEIKRSGIGPILKSTACTFRVPLVFPDTITVGAKVSEVKVDRFTMNYAIYSHHYQKIAAEGEGVVVSFNYHRNEKAPLPAKVADAINMLESTFSKNS